jgi:hypothetical protein
VPSVNYKFVRKVNSITAFLSRNRPSTDALNALCDWKKAYPQRSFTHSENQDDDEQLLVQLSWIQSDIAARSSLEDACNKFGVECVCLQI